MPTASQPPRERRVSLLAVTLLVLACVTINWRLGQRQGELEEGVDHSLLLLERYAGKGPVKQDETGDKINGNHHAASATPLAVTVHGGISSWAEGLTTLQEPNISRSDLKQAPPHDGDTMGLAGTLNRADDNPAMANRHAKRSGGSSVGGGSIGATRSKSGWLKEEIKARVAAMKDVAASRISEASGGAASRRAAGRGHNSGSSRVGRASSSGQRSGALHSMQEGREKAEPEKEVSLVPLPDEVVSFAKQAEMSEMARNFHSLIKSSNGRVTRCKGPKSEERPTIQSLPLKLTRYLSYNDLFVHQGNYRRLLGHGNFTQLKYPRLLPESATKLFERFGFDSCAVVGNSGALLYGKFGPVIDKHDVVFRLNQAPTKGYPEFVGKRTTFRLLNSLWTHRYSTMRKRDDLSRLRDFVWGDATSFWKTGEEQSLDATQLPLEKGAALIVSRCSVEEYSKLLKFWHARRPDVMVLMLNSRLVSVVRALMRMYRAHLCAAGWGPFEGGADPTSGLVASYIALHMCRLATVYGFGSERITEDKEAHTPYHYYKSYGARHYGNSKAHSFDTELNMMAQLYNHSSPHPFSGHWRYDREASAPGNARMCRTEKGYIANVHNLHCRGGWEPPAHDSGMLRAEGPIKLEEYKRMQERHRLWNIPLADVEMPNTKAKPAKWMKAMNLPSRNY